jgi:dihydroxyacetone kinase-like predicted kinase
MTSSRDQISKASWTLVESIKDSVSSNVVAASQTGQIDLKNLNLDRLLTIINASIEAGHQRATKAFLQEVDKVVAAVPLAPPAKKK